MLEEYLIEYCAPTLASLKSGSLFNCRCSAGEDIETCISEWNDVFRSKGISLHLMRKTETTALIYVCRQSALKSTLMDPEVRSFLKGYGYDPCFFCDGCNASCCSLDSCLRHLQARISERNTAGCPAFPHEIGIFLGYPLEDVSGFIENKGRNCSLTGAWKVYGDADSARRAFERFDKCSTVYNRLWKSGKRSIEQLTVAS